MSPPIQKGISDWKAKISTGCLVEKAIKPQALNPEESENRQSGYFVYDSYNPVSDNGIGADGRR